MRLNTLITQPHQKALALIAKPTKTSHYLRQLIHLFRIETPPAPDPQIKTHPSISHSLLISNSFDHFKRVKNYDWVIFTDGSKHPYGTGFGLAAYRGSDLNTPILQASTPLPKGTTIFTAEALAIKEAVTHAIEHIQIEYNIQPGSAFHIYTDSSSCLHSLRNPHESTHQNLFAPILIKTLNSHHLITFCHIPAHKGHTGNEKADWLANEAARLSYTIHEHPSFDHKQRNKSQILNYYTQHLEKAWESFLSTHPNIKTIFPTKQSWTDYKNNTFSLHRVHNLIHGSIPCYEYLYKIKIAYMDRCPICDVLDNPHHVILVCPRFATQRALYLQNQTSIPFLLTNSKETVYSLNTFLNETVYSYDLPI